MAAAEEKAVEEASSVPAEEKGDKSVPVADDTNVEGAVVRTKNDEKSPEKDTSTQKSSPKTSPKGKSPKGKGKEGGKTKDGSPAGKGKGKDDGGKGKGKAKDEKGKGKDGKGKGKGKGKEGGWHNSYGQQDTMGYNHYALHQPYAGYPYPGYSQGGHMAQSQYEQQQMAQWQQMMAYHMQYQHQIQMQMYQQQMQQPVAASTTSGPVNSAGPYEGSLKSINQRGHAFIVCAETYNLHNRDVYVEKAKLPNGAKVGDRVTFTVELSAKGHPNASTCELVRL